MLSFLALAVAMLSVPTPPSGSSDAVVIVNSGSTNTAGYRIVVEPDGTATYDIPTSASPAPVSVSKRKLESKVVRSLFKDVSSVASLDQLPRGMCMKSVSFGTKTYVQRHGVSSPDISCSSTDPRVTRLYQDVRNVEQQLGFPGGAARKFRRTL